MPQLIGHILGWLIVTVLAWFVALAIMGYGLGDILPWHWTIAERSIHLGIQLVLIGAFAFWRREPASVTVPDEE